MQVMKFFENCWFEDIGKIYFYPKGKKKADQMQKWSSFEFFITNVKIIPTEVLKRQHSYFCAEVNEYACNWKLSKLKKSQLKQRYASTP